MSRVFDWVGKNTDGFPRVSGDEPTIPDAGYKRERFSPRERG